MAITPTITTTRRLATAGVHPTMRDNHDINELVLAQASPRHLASEWGTPWTRKPTTTPSPPEIGSSDYPPPRANARSPPPTSPTRSWTLGHHRSGTGHHHRSLAGRLMRWRHHATPAVGANVSSSVGLCGRSDQRVGPSGAGLTSAHRWSSSARRALTTAMASSRLSAASWPVGSIARERYSPARWWTSVRSVCSSMSRTLVRVVVEEVHCLHTRASRKPLHRRPVPVRRVGSSRRAAIRGRPLAAHLIGDHVGPSGVFRLGAWRGVRRSKRNRAQRCSATASPGPPRSHRA